MRPPVPKGSGSVSSAPRLLPERMKTAFPKENAAKRLLVNGEALEKRLAASGRQRTEFRCIRDHAVLAVLIFCGLRRQEVLDLTVASVNLPAGLLLVEHGKGDDSILTFLGHSQLQTTAIYLHTDEEQVRRIAHTPDYPTRRFSECQPNRPFESRKSRRIALGLAEATVVI